MGRHRHPGDQEPARTDPPAPARWDADRHRRAAGAGGDRATGRTERAEPSWPERAEPDRRAVNRSPPGRIERGAVERYPSGHRPRGDDAHRPGARRGRAPGAGNGDVASADDSPGWTVVVLAGRIVLASAGGLVIWLGFRALWQRSALTVLAVLGFAAAALYGQHLVHRRRHPDEPPDLVSLLVIAVVALVLMVTPVAFVPG